MVKIPPKKENFQLEVTTNTTNKSEPLCGNGQNSSLTLYWSFERAVSAEENI